MINSFVLNLDRNLDRNLQNITAEDETTTVQKGEFIIKGYSEHIPAGDTPDDITEESFNINLILPAEMVKYAANVLHETSSRVTVEYNVVEGEDTVTIKFTAGGGKK